MRGEMRDHAREIGSGELYMHLEADFERLQDPARCANAQSRRCFMPMPFYCDPPESTKANWEIARPETMCPYCAELAMVIALDHQIRFDLHDEEPRRVG